MAIPILVLLGLALPAVRPAAAASAGAPSDIPQEVLAEVLSRQASIAFVGERVRIHFRGEDREEESTYRQRVFHAPPDEYRVDYLDLPEGRESHFVARGDHLYNWRSGTRVEMRERSPEETLTLVISLTYLDLLEENYRIRAEEGPEVAGRATYSIHVTGRIEGRPSILAWVDREHGVPLKVDFYDYNGNLDLRYEYTSITFQENLPAEHFQLPENAELRVPSREGYYASPEELAAKTELETPIADRPLSGFRLTDIRHTREEGTDRVQSFYSDGYATLSIFAQRNRKDAPRGLEEPGVRNISSERRRGYAIVRGWIGDMRITMISSDLPESRLLFMFPSIRLTTDSPRER